MDNGDMTTSILFICLYKLRLCAAAAPATMERFLFLALASRGTLPRVSQVCVNVRMVAGGHCVLGGARMIEASTIKRFFFQFLLTEPHALVRLSLSLCKCEKGLLDVIALWAKPA